MDVTGLNPAFDADPAKLVRLQQEGWRDRREGRRMTDIPVKVIRSNGSSQSAIIADLSDEGLRLDGVEGLTIGERVLMVLPNHRVREIAIRWAIGDQAGGRFINQQD